MGKSTQEVIVLDSEKRFLEYMHPGKARKLLGDKKAKIFSKSPFAIMLMRTVPAASIRRRKIMPKPRNFTDYFKNENDVYVQNVINAQVSCEFPVGHGRVEGFTFPHNRDPINLSQFIPFEAIKQSMDFRKMLSRRPPALQLLTQEEYELYYKKKALNMGLKTTDGKPDIDAVIDLTEDKRRRTSDRTFREPITNEETKPIHEVIEQGSGPGGAARFGEKIRVAHTDAIAEDEVINPRVLHLCNQVKSEIPEENRMPAKDLLEELQSIPDLSLDDLSHIRAHGYYKTVKTWAKKEESRISEEETVDDTDDKTVTGE